MEAIVGVVGGLLPCFCTPNYITTPVVEGCIFVINPTKHIIELLNKKANIIARKDDLISTLRRAEIEEGKKGSNVVTIWLEDVERFLRATDDIEEKANKTRRGMDRLLPNCCSRWTIGSTISRLLIEATELLQRNPVLLGEALTIMEERRGVELPVERIIGETMERVWGCLMNNEAGIVGVYGMGGVGKTTIVTEINNLLLKEKLPFDKVIWVTVSKSTSIRHIQVKIAEALNLPPLVGEDEEVSTLLFGALKRRKKVVLILDDMWEEVSLKKIGIPVPTEENGCKILLTTRKLEVCQKMRCGKNGTIKVELLSENEAWELFMHKVGVQLSGEVRKIAESVFKECAYLPLALVTVGGAMTGKEGISEWRVALNDLRYFRSQQIVGMETKVFGCLKFSYDRLGDENLKKCFLYCALFPEDWQIVAEKLIDYWIMGGLIEGKDSQDEIDQGQSILNKLKNHCLLESNGRTVSSEIVKMHDLVRDMALEYTSLLPSIVKAGVFLKELPNEAEWREDLVGASFMRNKIEEISISPRCPKLSILLLNDNWKLRSIQEDFFVQLQGLRVLDLSENKNLELLPNSIADLVNLHGLLLKGCHKLKSLPSLSKLQLLRTLDLRENHRLQSLPDSISKLTNLLVLRLSYCWELKSVPSVAKLRSLRKLELYGSGIRELPHGMEMLVNLTFLDLRENFRLQSLPDSISELKNLFVLRLSNCVELKSVPSVAKLRSLRKLELNNSGIRELPQGMEMLVNLTFLDLDGTNFKFRETTPSGLLSALSSVKSLHLEGLPQETLYALGSSNRGIWEDLFSLKQLESLHIDFSSLSDCAKYLKSPNYRGLKTFRIGIGSSDTSIRPWSDDVYRCIIRVDPDDALHHMKFLPQNTQLFHIQGFKDMRSLNELRCVKDAIELRECVVDSCDSLEYIIKHEEEEDECTLLQGLEVLKIDYCYKLQSVYKGNLSSAYRLTKLAISHCDNLKYVISSPRLLQHLQSLEDIYISHCSQLEEIIKAETAEEEGEATNIIITLPKLKYLYISYLPKLKNIWKGEMVCDSLENLGVTKCPELKRIPTHRGEQQSPPPHLQVIHGSSEWWDSLEWDHPFVKILLQSYFKPYRN